MHDTIVVGGGLTGLLVAREVAKEGFKVKVFEEDLEIGRPEKCDGLVSLRALRELGFTENEKFIRNKINKASIFSPDGFELCINSEKQGVVVIDRSIFDKEIARQATEYGAEIYLGSKVQSIEEDKVKIKGDVIRGKYIVDARGCKALVNYRKEGVILAGKYEVYGKWFERDKVEIYINQDLTPGFFLWVIPLSEDYARVGAAGYKVNPFKVIERFLKDKKCTIVKKIAAPINIGGTLNYFQKGRLFLVGDVAGQTKPTTAGGIYTGGVGALLASKCIIEGLKGNGNLSYKDLWSSKFSREFKFMKIGRRIFESLSNETINKLFRILKNFESKLSLEGDFDFHSKSILSFLKIKNITKR